VRNQEEAVWQMTGTQADAQLASSPAVSSTDASAADAAASCRDVRIRPVADDQWTIVAWLWQQFRIRIDRRPQP
jgi:hypothetical protein